MPKEQQPRPTSPSLQETFGFIERELRDYQLSHSRLLSLIDDPRTTIHTLTIDYNNYGEWLFLTLSRPTGKERQLVTFYGLGFHEHRECWYTNQWFWYRANSFPETLRKTVSKVETRRQIEARLAEVSRYAQEAPEPSSHAALFALIADLTDEDGALAELDDMDEDMLDWLSGEEE